MYRVRQMLADQVAEKGKSLPNSSNARNGDETAEAEANEPRGDVPAQDIPWGTPYTELTIPHPVQPQRGMEAMVLPQSVLSVVPSHIIS